MSTITNHTFYNCVQSLFDTLIDVSEGYKLLLDRAAPNARPFIAEVAQQHETAIEKIDAIATANGMELDRSGTLMSEIHKVAVRLRDLVTDIDRDALDAIARGEENVIKRYDDAIECLSPDDDLHAELIAERDALRNSIEKISEAA